MSGTCMYNCSAHPKEINAYGAISGIGVTTAFFATAWMVVLLLIGYYLVAYNPELDPFRQPGTKTPCQHPNAIDYVFRYAVRQLPGLRSLQRSDWLRSTQLESALNKCVIMFADIQIFTGFAVMISGYVALGCGLQSYHWQLTVYLVWLASLTHLAALSFLRNHFANNPSQLSWRVIAMVIMIMLLEVAVGLAGHFNWEKGPSKASDIAACYFRDKMHTESVEFESMIKALILLTYGFSIRLAKMSKSFEGGLRVVAARLSAKSKRRQNSDDNARSQDPQWRPKSFRVALAKLRLSLLPVYSLLSIHLNLLTSFLAEVYWLTLSALWVTRRYFRTRRLGPKEENEWTFGQVLPVLLVVAPLAAILEHFLPFRVPANRKQRQLSPIALAILRQLERDEAQDDDVPADMDHQHIHSVAYRGVFALAAAAYIEVGIFFVADRSPGIQEPLIRLGVAFFVLNPLLQLLWIYSTLWTSRMHRTDAIKRTVYSVTFAAVVFISVNEFLQALKEGESEKNQPIYSMATSYTTLVLICFLPMNTRAHNRIIEGKGRLMAVSFSIVSCCVTFAMGSIMSTWQLNSVSFLELPAGITVCLVLEFAWYRFELLVEKFKMAPKRAAYLRGAFLVCILAALVALQYGTSIAPGVTVLSLSIIPSAGFWGVIGAIVALVVSWQTETQDERATSTA